MKPKLKFHLTSYQHMRELSVMTFPCYFAALLVCIWASANAYPGLDYSAVKSLGSSCPQIDSCGYLKSPNRREVFSSRDRNCACDDLCSQYGDCCIDAPSNYMKDVVSHFSCFDLKDYGGVYMMDTCPASYRGPEHVKRMCEHVDIRDRTDPLGSMPVTDSSTGFTYKNYFCSMCNGRTDNIILWTPKLECPLLTLFNVSEDYVFQNLASVGDSWGLYLDGENGSLFFHDCDIEPVMPASLRNKIRQCKLNLISDCPKHWVDESTRTMCKSYMGAKYIRGGDGYKNVHCAVCNSANVSALNCQLPDMKNIFRFPDTNSFALLLDINEKTGQEVGKVQICENGEVYDPFFKKCRSLTCLPDYVRDGRRCLPRIRATVPPSSTNPMEEIIDTELLSNNKKDNVTYDLEHLMAVPDTTKLLNLTGKLFNKSAPNTEANKFQNCLLISLDDEDFIMLPNKTIFVPKYNKTYEPTSYHAADGSILVCTHFSSTGDSKFVPFLGYVTVFGLGVSMMFLLLHMVAFGLVPDLRNLSGKNLASQCVSLFFAHFCFMLGQFSDAGSSWCTAVSFLTFYFFQVSFFWMGAMAYDVWRTLKMATTELRVSGGKHWKRFSIYSFFTWCSPLFLVVLLAFAEYTTMFSLAYRPGFAQPRCWFKRRRALLVFFATPLFAIMLANIIFFISSARMIVMTTKSSMKHQNKSQQRNFKLYLRLALLMGLTWVTGLIAGYADMPFLWYLFVIFNSLQGLFIFVAFTCTTKVMNFLQSKFQRLPSNVSAQSVLASSSSRK